MTQCPEAELGKRSRSVCVAGSQICAPGGSGRPPRVTDFGEAARRRRTAASVLSGPAQWNRKPPPGRRRPPRVLHAAARIIGLCPRTRSKSSRSARWPGVSVTAVKIGRLASKRSTKRPVSSWAASGSDSSSPAATRYGPRRKDRKLVSRYGRFAARQAL